MKYLLFFILLFVSPILCFSQVDLNLGLKAYYPFNGNTNDASGNGLNATTFNGVQLTTDRFGNANSAYHFDGIDDYMKVSDNGVLSTPAYSICYYFNTESNTYQNCIGKINYTDGNGATYNSGIFQPASLPYFATISNTSGCNVQVTGTLVYTMYGAAIQPNQWHCIVNTFENGIQKMYLDGVLSQTNVPFSQSKYCTNTDFVIGSWWSGDTYRFKGKMDEIRYYDRAINQDEVNALCVLESCNDWLHTPSANSFARIGDLDVPGNAITVEANINRTQPYLPGTGNDNEGDIVSKHTDATNSNYILRPNHAYITTSDGFFGTPDICDLELNRTYHIAMVYDGATLKFYRDGFLMSQVNATGTLVQNNLNTQIGHYDALFWNTQFLGDINEVRIWNVARTQAQIQAYMNTSLPNPTTQTGLLAYYTFDNLLNKQGNPAWNATLFNGASINNTNANCDFIPDSCNVISTACSSWLHSQGIGQNVKIGDLDVSGNQLTIEATFNRTIPYSGGYLYAGDLVSKHLNASTTNYLLRLGDAEITTSNGFFTTSAGCDIELNKTYHVALVYNGSRLKFYRDGFLMSEVPATGNLVLNNYITTIGDWSSGTTPDESFKGYINEVRIWNVARTQDDIRTYMNASLPNPTTQPGLLAYYTFNDLANKQGNAAWNGTLNGAASVSAINPDCNFTADSCLSAISNIGNIINDYTPVLSLNPCNNSITVEDGTAFNAGDTVVLMQMKGAEIDESNTATFGTVLNYHNAGNYEFNYVKAKTGNIIELKNKLTRPYDIPNGKVQLIRVPYYPASANVSSTLTCLPWDGSKGGVLVLNVKDTLNLGANIDVTGRGFFGGAGFNSANPLLNCFDNDYIYPSTAQIIAGLKGESIVTLTPDIVRGKGADASGGGGGLGHNSGGGGGSNAGIGGFGGYQLDNCGSFPFDNRGIGGHALTYNSTANKVFMGGGGGAGNADNPNNYNPTGGNGGGIVIVNSGYLKSNGNIINADGDNGLACTVPPYLDCHDGMPGGGGGGAVLLNINQYLDNSVVQKKGGNGIDMITAITSGRIGPGGGGGGGMLFIKNPTLPAAVNSINTGGLNGVLTQDGNNPYGATPGAAGLNLFNLVIPFDTVLFKPNIDSVRIKDSITICRSFDFHGFGYTNTTGIVSWHWDFGDAATADVQNTSHTYSTNGNYNVTLVATDINGCRDSIIKQVIVVNCANNISNIINDYTPVLAFNPCKNALTVENGTAYNVGDTVLVIQMKGAIIDSTNTAAFGTILDYKNAGNYEFNYVKAKTGNIIELKNKLTRQYNIPNGKVQLIRVPYYAASVNISSTLTCLPWDGKKGGVLVFNVADTLALNADIDVTGKGFRGGNNYNVGPAVLECFQDAFSFDSSSIISGRKGEGITDLNPDKLNGRGPLANGGGGGNGHNSAGGGGSNASTGGFGGYQLLECSSSVYDNRGLGGIPLVYSNAANKIFMGGGGGSGHKDGLPTQTLSSAGGDGGGIVLVSANYLKSNTHAITANGGHGRQCDLDGFTCLHDGMGGGGGGGTILLNVPNYIDNHAENVNGGKGADLILYAPAYGHVGPGGGGSGGVVWFKPATQPVNATILNTGGVNGVIVLDSNNPFGSTPGQNGSSLTSLVVPVDTVLFKPNIDSVRIKDSGTVCRSFDFHGFGYTNTTGIVSWHWNFGDAATADVQNTSHTYSTNGTYNVTLVATDNNGCKDSIIKQVTVVNCTSNISNIINDYTPVLAFNPCKNALTVENGTAYNVGDTVLIIQMKGAVVDSTNTAAFGNIIDYKNAGNYEFNYIKAKTGNIIELKNKLTRQYDIPVGKVQLIRVPYYTSTTVSGTLTCLPWDGNKGGVLVLNARDTVTMNASIDVSAKGFPGAVGQNNIHPPVFNCFESNFFYLGTSYDSAATKGEGISTVSLNKILGKGKIANAGGGGNSHNSGGGGGGNYGTGGLGGYQFEGCGAPVPFDNRGIGGASLQYNNISNKIYMGGGGGAGQSNNPEGFTSNGGNGGAIAIIIAGTLINNGNNINNNGQDGESCSLGGTGCHEGMGGGGGAGVTLVKVPVFVNPISINSIGGKGADMVQAANLRVGPGGGGGGGLAWYTGSAFPAIVTSLTTGGINGTCTAYANDVWGSTPGINGTNLFNLVIPVDTVLFKPNIDSVRIKDSNTICRSFNFNGFGYTNTTGIASWHWNFGDSQTADAQNASHIYSANGNFNVTLTITDINGCKDSIIKQVTVINCANSISNIINDYTPVLAYTPCDNSLTVQDAAQFNAGDTVLLIQMKGAQIDSANTTSFGTVTNYNNAGNYEYNFVLSKTGNIIKLKNKLTRQYDLPGGRVQLIRVPYYTSTVVTSTLTCLPWDGAKGGVLAFNVRDTLTLTADIDVNAKGFRGGGTGNGFQCNQPEYAFALNTGLKGEGISELAGTWNAGGGHVANGGGGCFGGNSGAGGGSNIVAGGLGGQEYTGCGTLQGLGGQALTNNLNTKIYLGGAGGGGQQDNGFPIFDGGNGGGIVFISSNYVKGNSFNINANGQARPDTIHDEGGAAGGAGGSVILIANNIINTVNVNFTGGSGNSNFNTSFPFDCHGPGSGGSGGVVFFKQPGALANIAVNGNGGIAGLVLNPSSACYNTTHGATNGTNGGPRYSFVLNRDTVLFKPNIDSVRIQDNSTSCTGFDFHGFGYTNTNPIAAWDWDLGDGNHANTQNTSHGYSGAGPYTVHLVATDINGCKDSITTTITPTQVVVNAGLDTSFCSNGAVTHILHGTTTGTGYTWTPAGMLDNNTLQNPTATISSTTMFYLNTSSGLGCNAIDSVLLTVNPLPAVSTINDFSICKLDSMLLTTAGTATTYQWTPPLSVNNPSISNPYFHDTVSQQMIVTGTITATGCFKKDTVNVTIKPLPLVLSIPDTSLCGVHNVTLTTTGAQTYSWLPATGLSNSGIASPVFTGTGTQTFTVTGTGANSCKASDTVTITVRPQPAVSTINDISICRGDSVQLTSNSTAESNQWTPALSVSNPTIINPYFHDTVSQQMIITGTNASGCFAKDTVNITVKPLPVVQTIPDSALCGAHNITLTTTGAQTYSWLPATNLSNSGIASPVFTGTSTQTYTVTGTGANACKSNDTVTITINAVPVLNTITNTSICKGDSVQLISNSNAESNHWSPATSVSNPAITNPYFIDTVSQTMIITGTNNSTGCFSTASVNITVKPTPDVRSIPDFTSCAVNTVTLTTTGAQTYSWTPATNLNDPAIASPIFTGTTGTYTYSVTGTAPNGCIAKDTVTVIIAPKPVFNAPANKTICANESVQLDGNNGTTYEYLWTPANHLSNTTIVDPMANPVTTTTYTLLITDHTCNYDSTFSVRVTVNQLPVVSATRSNDLDCSTPESQLTAFGASQYDWTPAEGLNDHTVYNPIASPYITTQYIVVGTDLNGCSNKDTVIVRRKGGKYFGFDIPNSFTPNRDNLNDCWGVTYWGETKNFHLMIFNRWGEKVFETHNVSECWDGNYKGNPSSVGNYVFYLTGETLCGTVTRKGNLLLIR